MGKQSQLDFTTMPAPNPAMIQQLAAAMHAEQAAPQQEYRQVSQGKAFVGWGVLFVLLGILGVAVATDNGRKQISEATAGLPVGEFADRFGAMGKSKIDGVEVDPFYEYVKSGRRTFADNVKVRLFKTYCVDKQGGYTQDEQQICEWASEEFAQILATRQANTYQVKVPK